MLDTQVAKTSCLAPVRASNLYDIMLKAGLEEDPCLQRQTLSTLGAREDIMIEVWQKKLVAQVLRVVLIMLIITLFY